MRSAVIRIGDRPKLTSVFPRRTRPCPRHRIAFPRPPSFRILVSQHQLFSSHLAPLSLQPHPTQYTMSSVKVIVVGGGLSGLSAAHTLLERGCSVLLLDKNGFMGGNSTKATSGINGAGTGVSRRFALCLFVERDDADGFFLPAFVVSVRVGPARAWNVNRSRPPLARSSRTLTNPFCILSQPRLGQDL
jgi:hypothetical protein